MRDNLTVQEIDILEKMNKGDYLIKKENGEGLSKTGWKIYQTIKVGTIQRLVIAGFIFKSIFITEKYMLTDEGRKYRSHR